jgi:gamma-glutamyltranspeptidase / glutathione hydrolase
MSAPPPATGPALLLTTLKVLEADDFGGGPLRTADNLDHIGRAWRVVAPLVARQIADVPEARFNFEKLVAPDSVAAIRAAAFAPAEMVPKKAATLQPDSPAVAFDEPYYESEMAATTQWMIVDAEGNIACCTQSLSLHFGAGVVAPGTGVVLNDSMSNFSFADPRSINFVAPGKRSRSTICPTLGFRDGRPVFAAGIPGAARIPTALLQALLDRIVLGRPWAEAIGDTRIHFAMPVRKDDEESIEAESSFPEQDAAALRARGWKIVLAETPGRGRHFGGINVIEIGRDGTRTGYADPRRTNAAAGY